MKTSVLFNTQTPVTYRAEFVNSNDSVEDGKFIVLGKSTVAKEGSDYIGQDIVRFQIGDNPLTKMAMLGQVLGAYKTSGCKTDFWATKGNAKNKEINPKLEAKITKGSLIFLS